MKKNTFAIQLKNLRKKHNLTQSQLGEMLGYNKSVICDWETRGKEPKFDMLIKIAEIFNVTTDFILGAELKEKTNDKNK